MTALAPLSTHFPALIADAGERAQLRTLEFFTANIRNPNTRRAYVQATKDFAMAAHASTRTAKLYDRRDELTLDEVERIAI